MELCQNSELFKAPKRAVLPHFQLTLTSIILGSSSCNYADLVTLPFSIKKAQARFNKYYFKGGGGGGGKGGRWMGEVNIYGNTHAELDLSPVWAALSFLIGNLNQIPRLKFGASHLKLS